MIGGMTSTTITIERLNGGRLVLAGDALAERWLTIQTGAFDEIAGTTRRDRITTDDLDIINKYLRARTSYKTRKGSKKWEPILNRQFAWIQRLKPEPDLITTGTQAWRAMNGDDLVRDAFRCCLGDSRGIAVASKLLHSKWPRLFPILDRLVVELIGAERWGDSGDRSAVPSPEDDKRVQRAVDLVLQLRAEAKKNLPALRNDQQILNQDGRSRSLIRTLDAILWAAHPASNVGGLKHRVIRA
jgi:hypothetical protein